MPETQTSDDPRWMCVVSQRDGFVIAEDELRAWCADPHDDDMAPTELAIVTGTAKPQPYGDPDDLRMPGTFLTADEFHRVDVHSEDGPALLAIYLRAQAVAAAMNAAGVL